MIVGQTARSSCNQSGPEDAMIAIPATDNCSPLQVAIGCLVMDLERDQ
jgi:hypothetical protein